jgi:8-oxo-dGTP pyrophosphatase MutT (NUDIX family)
MRMKKPDAQKNFPCNDEFRRQIVDNLKTFEVRPGKREGTRRAAVAITVVECGHGPGVYGMPKHDHWDTDAAVILTRRAAGLKNHAGQWAFPGGRMEKGETAEETALRELQEEVGLDLSAGHILGRLDDYTTRSGFTITPVVIWGGIGIRLNPDPSEVASAHRIPLQELMRPDAPILENIPESENPVLLMPVGNSWIASPTAAMLCQFREVAVLGCGTRVAHFEQPYFAWK